MATKRNEPSWNKIKCLAELCYEGNANKAGIYQIIQKEKGRKYIGSTYSFKERWKNHLGDLRNNKHYNSFLQNDFNSSGESLFKFEILEITEGDRKQREDREQYWLDQLFGNNDKNMIYNTSKKAVITLPRKPTEKPIKMIGIGLRILRVLSMLLKTFLIL